MEREPGNSESVGRGARKRREAREAQQRREALRWFAQPAVAIFALAVALAAGGWGLVWWKSQRITVREATVDGLELHLEQARWVLDQMDHGENYSKPSVMMPDMPEWGLQRVTVELALINRSGEDKVFDGEELFLVPDIGEPVPPMGAQVGRARIAPGHHLNTAVHFDFDTTGPHGKLRVEWRRGNRSVYLPIPEPAEHYHLRPRDGELNLPPDARMVQPLGDAARGRKLFLGVFGCVACHGDPEVPGSNNVGPHLAGIAAVADSRQEGVPGMQYLYESILDPNSFIAPLCSGGLPCESPSAMPEYASLMSVQNVADLLNYLIEQRQAPAGTEATAAAAPGP
jgi:cytochrome c553